MVVTPCVGVWIETSLIESTITIRRHTLRGCVDWNLVSHTIHNSRLSHTLRGCVDWNNINITRTVNKPVTPCVGVWIETSGTWSYQSMKGHTLRGCVDWNMWNGSTSWATPGHTLRGCVDWNLRLWFPVVLIRHTLRGCVDWNDEQRKEFEQSKVTPCVGVWIETPLLLADCYSW